MNDAMQAQQRLMQAIQTYQTGDLVKAEKELTDLLQKFPKSDQVMSVLGAVLFSQKKHKEAFRHYREAVKINPKNVEAVMGMASTENARGNVEMAIALAERALIEFPERLEIYFNLGTFYIEKDDMEGAERCFLKCIELEPRLHQADLHLVNVYKELNQLDKVEHHLKKVIAVNPDPQLKAKLKEIIEEKGSESEEIPAPVVLEEEENLELQEASAAEVFGIEEGDIEGLLSLAAAFFERHQYTEARQYFEKVLEIDAGHEGALIALGKIRSASVPLWHFEMLADHDRNDAYEAALERALKQQPGTRVLDIGTGSGLLAMMAARAGASEVLACEMNGELADMATRIVKANGYEDKITVLNRKSSDLKPGLDFEGKYDLVVSEILDVAGVGEGVLPSLRHAYESILKPGAVTIPSGMTMYAQLLSVPDFYRVNPIKEISGFDLSPFNDFRSPDEYIPVKLNAMKHEALSEPVAFHSFDFAEIPEYRDESNPHTIAVDFPVTKEGRVQAVAFWFDLHLDDQLTLSSGLGGKLKHWGQALCFMEQEISVASGTDLAMTAKFYDLSMWFEPRVK